jgi:hypothetical protein
MRKEILILCGLGILLLPPTLASSDCVDLRRSTIWHVQGGHTIIFYDRVAPLIHHRIFTSSRIMFVTMTTPS